MKWRTRNSPTQLLSTDFDKSTKREIIFSTNDTETFGMRQAKVRTSA
jgi:hypothetical protein